MQHAVLAGCTLIVAFLPWAGAPRDGQESGVSPGPPAEIAAERIAARREALLGAWQLVSAKVAGTAVPALDAAGYLIVVEDYLALEVHLVMPTAHAVGSDQPFFQSAIRRWRLAGEARLETSALIGNTNINEAERWDFERPGSRTVFEILLAGDTLVLERPGDSRLTFEKLPVLPFPGDAAERARAGAGGGR